MFKVNEKRLIQEFLKLVQIDSETTKESKIAALLKRKFQHLGCNVTEDDTKEKTNHGAGNLICFLEGTLKAVDPIYFTAHMDTVAPGKSITPILRKHYITSDGTTILGADDKAGIVAMLEAIHVLQEQKIDHGSIQFIITVGEEAGLVGSKAIDPNNIRASFGYTLDNPGPVGNIVIKAPAHAHCRVTIAPSSTSNQSAHQIASQAISDLPLGQVDEKTDIQIKAFQSKKVNDLELLLDVRSFDHQLLQDYIKKIQNTFMLTATHLEAKVQFNTHLLYPSFYYKSDDKVVKIARSAAQMIGRKSRLQASSTGSDANIFTSYGIPTVNLSVGYEHYHTTKERIAVKELIKLTELVVAIIKKVAEHRNNIQEDV